MMTVEGERVPVRQATEAHAQRYGDPLHWGDYAVAARTYSRYEEMLRRKGNSAAADTAKEYTVFLGKKADFAHE